MSSPRILFYPTTFDGRPWSKPYISIVQRFEGADFEGVTLAMPLTEDAIAALRQAADDCEKFLAKNIRAAELHAQFDREGLA